MNYVASFTDGNGRRFRGTVKIVDMERVARVLVQRARNQGRNRATALEGAIICDVEELS